MQGTAVICGAIMISCLVLCGRVIMMIKDHENILWVEIYAISIVDYTLCLKINTVLDYNLHSPW